MNAVVRGMVILTRSETGIIRNGMRPHTVVRRPGFNLVLSPAVQ